MERGGQGAERERGLVPILIRVICIDGERKASSGEHREKD